MKRVTDQQKNKIKELYLSGKSQEECGNLLGIERTVVGYWTRRFGISRDLSESHVGRPNKSSTKFKKGQAPWNKGKSPAYVQRENNPAWKGGVVPIHKKLRESDKYKQWRQSIFVRDDFSCFECGHQYTNIIAHHLEPFSDFPERRFDEDNGITMCRACHCKLHQPTGV